MEAARPTSTKKYADDASGATGDYERKYSYDVSPRGENISTSQKLEEKLEKESSVLKEQRAAESQNEVERQYHAEALRIELTASAENRHASQFTSTTTSNLLTAQLHVIEMDGSDRQQIKGDGDGDSGELVDFILDGGNAGGGVDFVFDQDLLISALKKEEHALVDILKNLPNENGCIIGIDECCDREGELQSTGAGHACHGELEGTVMYSAKDFVVGSRALICDLKQLVCEVGCSGQANGSLGNRAMPNGDVAIYASDEVSSGGALLANDEKAKQVEKVEQQEEYGPFAHEGGRAKALRVKMPAQRALQMANEKVDADTPPKQSVSVDAGERKEHKGKTKFKRSKTTLQKQKSVRKEKPPRSGIMVSLGLVLAVVAFIIAVVAVGVPSSSPRYHHVNKKEKFKLYMSYADYEEVDEQYMGTTRLGTGVLLVDLVNALPTEKHACASRSISSPFHMITTLPYASVLLEPVARAEGGDQCDRELRANEERITVNEERNKVNEERNRVNEERLKASIKANGEMLEEKENIIRMLQEELQENSRMARVHHSSRVTRGQPTPSRNAHRKFRRTSSLISSSLRPLHTPIRTNVEGAVQLQKGLPLAVSVDVGSGDDSPSCILSSSSAAPTSSCKTIRYALKHGQIAARKTSSPLELAVSAGVYHDECSEEGITVTMAITLKKARGGEVLIDCKGAGSLLNITQDSSATSRLEGVTIANGSSKRGGGAASVGGGGLVLKDCVFRELTSQASSADGDFVGGGAVSFVVRAAFL
jgi:hypothetical protein